MFEDFLNTYEWDRVQERIYSATEDEVRTSLARSAYDAGDLYCLLSPAADAFLEEMAQKSSRITRMRFGNTIQLYAPLYISNECTNTCLYCGFNARNDIRRITLSLEQVENEALLIYNAGFRHILLLTGEDKKATPVDHLAEIGRRIHSKFASVSIEVYPMETDEYKLMAENGIDGLTLYQETYNKKLYNDLHPSGMKKNFQWRLGGPDRGGMAGLRKIGVGALLGLSDWRIDSFFTAMHALYLSRRYWKSHIQVSFPRMRGAIGGCGPITPVSDRDLVHLISVMRIILPDAGLLLSTREPAELRDRIFPLGITVMSAGSRTNPGGYGNLDIADSQFDVVDERSPDEISVMLRSKGFDPVWKDWDRDFIG